MSIAIQGIVITKHASSTSGIISYRYKCEKCGFVETGSHTTQAGFIGGRMTSAFMCQKCKIRQIVELEY